MAQVGRAQPGGAVDRWWFAGCGILLIFASDYKFRTRDPAAALSASIDIAILLEIALYGLVAGYLVLTYRKADRQRVTPPVYCLCLFVGLLATSLSYTPFKEYALVRVVQMGILLALVLAAIRVANRAHLHRFAHAFVVLVVLSVAYGALIPSPPVNRLQEGRFTWLALHPTTAGVVTGLATVVATAYVLAGSADRPGPQWPRALYLGAACIVGGGLMAAHTRGAVLGAAAGVLALIASSRRGRSTIEAVLAGLVFASVVAIGASQAVVAYFVRDEEPANLATLNSRTDLWATATDAFTENPLFGYGVNSAQGIFYDETGLGGGHNIVVNLLVEVGTVGLLVFAGLLVALLIGIKRLPRSGSGQIGLDRALLFGVLTFLLVDGIFHQGAGATTNVASTWLFICVAWWGVVNREANRRVVAPTVRRTFPGHTVAAPSSGALAHGAR